MKFTYTTNGVCSRSIDIEVENDTVVSVNYQGGCNGNLKGIGSLVAGMKVDDVINRLEGIKCGFKNTSCPAQLALALKKMKAEDNQ
ncbi:MAG: TIGR03905 family TSCPD domain-containing protein [Clostridia bacterium]|nr:TIGR03905 family TSCPD domain-containing protein [Clostridia bacterium]